MPYCMQLWPGLHWRDRTEGTSGCLQERYDGEIGCDRACMGEPPPHPLGGDISTGQSQKSRGNYILLCFYNCFIIQPENHFCRKQCSNGGMTIVMWTAHLHQVSDSIECSCVCTSWFWVYIIYHALYIRLVWTSVIVLWLHI